ncbi:unnamed protein product [Mortierella alpina]
MTKKHHNSSKNKAKPKAAPDVDVSPPFSPATTTHSSEKRDLCTENEGLFADLGGYNFPDYRNGNLATPLPSRSSSLASEASLNSLADLVGHELDDDEDSVQDQEHDHDHDSQEGCKSTNQVASVAECEEVHDDLWSWISTGREKTQPPPGLQGRDWAAIGVLTLTAVAVRLWEIDTPNQVVVDEAHVGKYVNGYLTKQFIFDTHPPLGKMLLAGISKIAGHYSGTFPFDNVSDTYPSELPYMAMRSVVASMGALCAPMAFLTLRALGQAPFAAILAAFMIIFDNALMASHRLMTLEAPLLFFTALSLMAWAKFTEQESRPFTALWWTWLGMTGVAVAGASATKTHGLLTLGTIAVLAGWDLSHQPPYRTSAQGDYDLTLLSHPLRHSLLSPYVEDQNPTQAWSDVVYGSVIQLQSETRPAVFLHSFNQMWNHSAVAPVHDDPLDRDPRRYQQVAGYEYSDLNTLWIVVQANMTSASAAAAKGGASIEHLTNPKSKQDGRFRKGENEIPTRLQYLKDGDLIRLRHVSTRRCLHSRNVPSTSDRRREIPRSQIDRKECYPSCEVSAVGEAGSSSEKQNSNNSDDGDDGPQDWWTVQVIESKPLDWMFPGVQGRTGSRIKALETTFRLRHHVLGCFLHTSERELPEEVLGGAGRRELSCVRDENLQESTVWRITMNEHDYLPVDTALALYPELSTLQKIAELHTLMWTRPRADAASEFMWPSDSQPSLWSLMMGSTSARTLWRSRSHDVRDVQEAKEEPEVVKDSKDGSTMQQNSVVANPAVWWTSTLGLAVFAGLQVLFLLGGLLGCMEEGSLLAMMKQRLSASTPIFAAWAIHALPLLFPLLPKTHRISSSTLDLYYPALYCAVLVSSAVLSSLLDAFVSRRHQFSLLLVLILIITSISNLISPLSYGTHMTRGQCEYLAHWVNKGAALVQIPELAQQAPITTRPTVVLDCGTLLASAAASTSFSLTPLQITPVVRRKRVPVLQKHYPAIEEALPMQHIFMTPSQRPPQLWHVNRQAGEPNPYQRQQMQPIFELIEKEEKEKRVKERLEREEKERLERQERLRLELEEKRREMERAMKQEQEAKERERRRWDEKRRREVEEEVEEELRREQELREVAW